MNELALFAGAGGGILGGKLLGWRTVCAVEWEAYAASVLCARQNDGALPAFPIWDDVRTFDGRPWRGIVDVVSGGFPCQDISAAGKGAGIEGERSGMWTEMARIIGEVRPRFAFVENSPMLTTRGGTRVIADLTQMGYDTRWTVMGAADIGAPHQRDRMWIVARQRELLSHPQHHRDGWREQQQKSPTQKDGVLANPSSFGSETGLADTQGWKERDTNQSQYSGVNLAREPLGQLGQDAQPERPDCQVADAQCIRPHTEKDERIMEGEGARELCAEQPRSDWGAWWATEPDLGRVAHGVAARVDRLKAIGNGQVPAVAALAWEMLTA